MHAGGGACRADRCTGCAAPHWSGGLDAPGVLVGVVVAVVVAAAALPRSVAADLSAWPHAPRLEAPAPSARAPPDRRQRRRHPHAFAEATEVGPAWPVPKPRPALPLALLHLARLRQDELIQALPRHGCGWVCQRLDFFFIARKKIQLWRAERYIRLGSVVMRRMLT